MLWHDKQLFSIFYFLRNHLSALVCLYLYQVFYVISFFLVSLWISDTWGKFYSNHCFVMILDNMTHWWYSVYIPTALMMNPFGDLSALRIHASLSTSRLFAFP